MPLYLTILRSTSSFQTRPKPRFPLQLVSTLKPIFRFKLSKSAAVTFVSMKPTTSGLCCLRWRQVPKLPRDSRDPRQFQNKIFMVTKAVAQQPSPLEPHLLIPSPSLPFSSSCNYVGICPSLSPHILDCAC